MRTSYLETIYDIKPESIFSLQIADNMQARQDEVFNMTKFIPGQSGNPSGKKRGTLNKRSQLAKLLEPHAVALINKAVELALAGDSNALRLCIERLIPKAKDDIVKVIFPDITPNNSKKIVSELLQALSGKELCISELRNLINLINEYNVEHTNTTNFQQLTELVKKYERDY